MATVKNDGGNHSWKYGKSNDIVSSDSGPFGNWCTGAVRYLIWKMIRNATMKTKHNKMLPLRTNHSKSVNEEIDGFLINALQRKIDK